MIYYKHSKLGGYPMIFENQKYTVQLDDKGAIVSLISSGKQFLKTRLPLLNLQLRSGEKTEILNSDDAKSIDICKADDTVTIKYDFDDLVGKVSYITPVPGGVGSVTTAT